MPRSLRHLMKVSNMYFRGQAPASESTVYNWHWRVWYGHTGILCVAFRSVIHWWWSGHFHCCPWFAFKTWNFRFQLTWIIVGHKLKVCVCACTEVGDGTTPAVGMSDEKPVFVKGWQPPTLQPAFQPTSSPVSLSARFMVSAISCCHFAIFCCADFYDDSPVLYKYDL